MRVKRSVGLIQLCSVLWLGACSSPADEPPMVEDVSPIDHVRITPDVVYGHKAGMALTFDVYQPAEANGAAVAFVNSGGFVSGQFRQYETLGWGRYRLLPSDSLRLEGQSEVIPLLGQAGFARLLESGFTVFDVRHGGSPYFKLPEIVNDTRSAIRYIVKNAGEFGVESDRIGLWGGSAGGYLVLEAAFADPVDEDGMTADRIRAVAVFYPAGYDFAADAENFPEVIAGLPALQLEPGVLDSLSLRHVISPDDPPCLVIYGTEDFPFITGASDSIYAALTQAGVECRRIAIPGVGHEFRRPDGYDPAAGERASREVVTWFKETLAGP